LSVDEPERLQRENRQKYEWDGILGTQSAAAGQ